MEELLKEILLYLKQNHVDQKRIIELLEQYRMPYEDHATFAHPPIRLYMDEAKEQS